MSAKHLSKRSRSFRQTLLGIVKSYHETFCLSKDIRASKLVNSKRWHPVFKLEECEPIKQGENSISSYFRSMKLLHCKI